MRELFVAVEQLQDKTTFELNTMKPVGVVFKDKSIMTLLVKSGTVFILQTNQDAVRNDIDIFYESDSESYGLYIRAKHLTDNSARFY